jgi:hypothetical protein
MSLSRYDISEIISLCKNRINENKCINFGIRYNLSREVVISLDNNDKSLLLKEFIDLFYSVYLKTENKLFKIAKKENISCDLYDIYEVYLKVCDEKIGKDDFYFLVKGCRDDLILLQNKIYPNEVEYDFYQYQYAFDFCNAIACSIFYSEYGVLNQEEIPLDGENESYEDYEMDFVYFGFHSMELGVNKSEIDRTQLSYWKWMCDVLSRICSKCEC